MKILIPIFTLGILGSVLKIIGGVIYGSNTLFIDAMTSLANIATLVFTVYFIRKAIIPPDSTHHFGHERFEYAGVLIAVIIYSFAIGVSITRLYYIREYVVLPGALVLATISMLFYGLAIFLSISRSPALRAYGLLTVSELIEGSMSIVASIGGIYFHYLIDYVCAIALTVYVVYEIIDQGDKIVNILVDMAPSEDIYYKIYEELRRENLDVRRLRLRVMSRGKLHGDTVIYSDRDISDTLERVRKRLLAIGADLCFEVRKR